MDDKRASEIITTPRLSLRPLTNDDAARIAEVAGVWELASMTARIPYPYSEEQAHQWIGGSAPGEFVRGIELQGTLIGCCGFMPIARESEGNHDEQSVEIGYWIGKDYWGRGFATEAATAIVAECKRRGFSHLHAGHFHDNPASARVLIKLGFKHVGHKDWWGEARQCNIRAERYEMIAS